MGNIDSENSKYKYDAFISYRHCQPDQFVAENLHKQLETFKLPKNVLGKIQEKNPEAKTKICRVFRDQEELPLATNLEDPIVDALKVSEWLIVVCSPRLKESMWCRKEIETFIKLHGRERVMAILVEGEPSESFPEELLHRDVEVVKPDGSKEIISEPVEPLAADVRGKTNKEIMTALKSEVIRLLAPMFGLEYDELKQRHRERLLRKRIAIAVTISVISIMFGLLGTFSAIKINNQKNEIVKQKDEIEAKSLEIEAQADEIASQNEELKAGQARNMAADSIELANKDDKEGAVSLAYQALTEVDGIKMPYTDEAKYALLNALRPYDLTGAACAEYQIETSGIVEQLYMSPTRNTLMVYDSSSTVTFWSVEKKEIINKLFLEDSFFEKNNFWLIDDETLLYADNNNVYEYKLLSGEKKVIGEEDSLNIVGKMFYDYSSGTLYVKRSKSIVGYDNNYKQCFEYNYPEGEVSSDSFRYLRDSYLEVTTTLNATDINNSVTVVRVIDGANDCEEVLREEIIGETYETSLLSNGTFYVVTTKINRMGSAITGGSSVLRAYSLASGKLLWERSDMNVYADKLAEIQEKDGTYLVEIGKRGLVEVNEESGEAALISFEDEDIVWTGATPNAIVYMTAKPIEMYLTGHTTMGFSSGIYSNLNNIQFVQPASDDGYFMAAKNSNKVVYYGISEADKMEEYSGEFEIPECENYTFGIDNEEIEALGLPEAELIKNVAIPKDANVICVSGKDGAAKLYNSKSKELITLWELRTANDPIKYYLGEDNDGNVYWAGDTYGYAISKNNILVGDFELLRGVDAKNGKYIFGTTYNDERFTMPIYSIDELLDMASEYVR